MFVEWQTITKVSNSEGLPSCYVSLFTDITDSWRRGEHIRHLAFHDALTDLPNRSLLLDRLERQIALAEREKRFFAVMFLDLDGFKLINDHHGHHIGDSVLKEVAERLKGLIRQSDTVARLGGDEFVVVLDNPTNKDEVAHIAHRVVTIINEPMEIHGAIAQVGASIGIATFPNDGDTPAALFKNADTAMYAAKVGGKNTYRFFSLQ